MALFDRLVSASPDWLLSLAFQEQAPPLRGAAPVGGADPGAGAGNGPVPLGTPGPGGGAPGGGAFDLLLPLFLAFMLMMIFMSVMGGRKQKKQQAALLSGLRKHDKVRMLGGIIGTIAEIHDTEVVIKVDESTNTRIRFAKDAVQTVLRSAAGAASTEPERVE